MTQRRKYPEEGETWWHPLSYSMYVIHSRTSDGWVRFNIKGEPRPLYTMETDRFMSIYEKKV